MEMFDMIAIGCDHAGVEMKKAVIVNISSLFIFIFKIFFCLYFLQI